MSDLGACFWKSSFRMPIFRIKDLENLYFRIWNLENLCFRKMLNGVLVFISKIQKEQHETEPTIESLISNRVFKRILENLLQICKRI